MPTPEELRDLASKYEEMLRLRLEDEAGVGGDPRRRMVGLAVRFPGALREIDELPLEAIRARIAALVEAAHGTGVVEPWMAVMVRFHALLRGALCAKRWLAGRGEVDAATASAFDDEADGLCFAEEARAWREDLARVAKPPRGRVTDLVFGRIAEETALTEEEARRLVFGFSRKRRAPA